MFRKEDIIIEFLEETKELHIPSEILEDKTQTLQVIEETLDKKIPEQYHEKKKLDKYLEETNQEYVDFKKQKKPELFIKSMVFFCLFLIPLMILFWFITKNTNLLVLRQLNHFIVPLIIELWLISTVLAIILIVMKIRKKKWEVKHSTLVTVGVLITYSLGVFSLTDLLYGNDKKYQDFIIKESMSTKDHQFIANIFYNNRIIENTLSRTEIYGASERLYEFEPIDFEKSFYANAHEKEVLSRDYEEQIYKTIKVEGTSKDSGTKYSGYLTIVYDPAHVKLGTSIGAGTTDGSYGQTLAEISQNNQALVAMNAGGFYDPNWNSNGGIPHGVVIQNGEIKTEYNRGIESGGMIAFTKDNQLVLKHMTSQEAIQMGVRDAVDWGPFLIVNGQNHFKNDTSKWACARSVIGQRKDGIVLMLVIDGDQPHSKGASYKDLADIMESYGAYNASSLDGGTSTAMVEKHEYINIPFNGQKRTIRRIPNAWIVTE